MASTYIPFAGGDDDAGWEKFWYVNDYNYSKYRYMNGMVTLVGVSAGSLTIPGASNVNLGALPAQYRPTFDIPFSVTNRANQGNCSGLVRNTGVVTLENPFTATAYWIFSVTFPCG